jgi:hypothetical protein
MRAVFLGLALAAIITILVMFGGNLFQLIVAAVLSLIGYLT